LFIFLLLTGLPVFAARETFNGRQVAARQVLIKLQAPSAAILQQLRQSGDADDLRQLSRTLGIYLLHSRGLNVPALLTLLRALPFVAYAEPDYVVQASLIPNDQFFSQQSSFLNTGTPGADIGATAAWDISTGSTANVVGVVDTGIDYTHPDLAPN